MDYLDSDCDSVDDEPVTIEELQILGVLTRTATISRPDGSGPLLKKLGVRISSVDVGRVMGAQITAIDTGSPASLCKGNSKINVGDVLIAVDETPLVGKTFSTIMLELAECGQRTTDITLAVVAMVELDKCGLTRSSDLSDDSDAASDDDDEVRVLSVSPAPGNEPTAAENHVSLPTVSHELEKVSNSNRSSEDGGEVSEMCTDPKSGDTPPVPATAIIVGDNDTQGSDTSEDAFAFTESTSTSVVSSRVEESVCDAGKLHLSNPQEEPCRVQDVLVSKFVDVENNTVATSPVVTDNASGVSHSPFVPVRKDTSIEKDVATCENDSKNATPDDLAVAEALGIAIGGVEESSNPVDSQIDAQCNSSIAVSEPPCGSDVGDLPTVDHETAADRAPGDMHAPTSTAQSIPHDRSLTNSPTIAQLTAKEDHLDPIAVLLAATSSPLAFAKDSDAGNTNPPPLNDAVDGSGAGPAWHNSDGTGVDSLATVLADVEFPDAILEMTRDHHQRQLRLAAKQQTSPTQQETPLGALGGGLGNGTSRTVRKKTRKRRKDRIVVNGDGHLTRDDALEMAVNGKQSLSLRKRSQKKTDTTSNATTASRSDTSPTPSTVPSQTSPYTIPCIVHPDSEGLITHDQTSACASNLPSLQDSASYDDVFGDDAKFSDDGVHSCSSDALVADLTDDLVARARAAAAVVQELADSATREVASATERRKGNVSEWRGMNAALVAEDADGDDDTDNAGGVASTIDAAGYALAAPPAALSGSREQFTAPPAAVVSGPPPTAPPLPRWLSSVPLRLMRVRRSASVGFGFKITRKGGCIRIIDVKKYTPSFLAGVQVGDVVLYIGNVSVLRSSVEKVGTVIRNAGDLLSLTVTTSEHFDRVYHPLDNSTDDDDDADETAAAALVNKSKNTLSSASKGNGESAVESSSGEKATTASEATSSASMASKAFDAVRQATARASDAFAAIATVGVGVSAGVAECTGNDSDTDPSSHPTVVAVQGEGRTTADRASTGTASEAAPHGTTGNGAGRMDASSDTGEVVPMVPEEQLHARCKGSARVVRIVRLSGDTSVGIRLYSPTPTWAIPNPRGIRISKIFPDSPAERTHNLVVGDVVLEVNGVPVVDASHPDVVGLIKSTYAKRFPYLANETATVKALDSRPDLNGSTVRCTELLDESTGTHLVITPAGEEIAIAGENLVPTNDHSNTHNCVVLTVVPQLDFDRANRELELAAGADAARAHRQAQARHGTARDSKRDPSAAVDADRGGGVFDDIDDRRTICAVLKQNLVMGAITQEEYDHLTRVNQQILEPPTAAPLPPDSEYATAPNDGVVIAADGGAGHVDTASTSLYAPISGSAHVSAEGEISMANPVLASTILRNCKEWLKKKADAMLKSQQQQLQMLQQNNEKRLQAHATEGSAGSARVSVTKKKKAPKGKHDVKWHAAVAIDPEVQERMATLSPTSPSVKASKKLTAAIERDMRRSNAPSPYATDPAVAFGGHGDTRHVVDGDGTVRLLPLDITNSDNDDDASATDASNTDASATDASTSTVGDETPMKFKVDANGVPIRTRRKTKTRRRIIENIARPSPPS